ncbi:hypothetical protein Pcinc_004511 [Petrolisthes cinctipes]|uniref:Uncharacterized protein n=1 Tax=Petrolisthes cinctipes TaxID=88211 RepID=A0AAE1GGX8_PETCI|nr:hypothetical protein Pcinc_004511 [Petrolisthes cinctipes]
MNRECLTPSLPRRTAGDPASLHILGLSSFEEMLCNFSKRQLQFAIRIAMEIWKGSLLRQRYLLNREIFQRQLQIASLRAAYLEKERKNVLEKLVLWPMRHHSKWVKILLNYTEKSGIYSVNWIWRKGKRKIFLGKWKIFLRRRKHVKNL